MCIDTNAHTKSLVPDLSWSLTDISSNDFFQVKKKNPTVSTILSGLKSREIQVTLGFIQIYTTFL